MMLDRILPACLATTDRWVEAEVRAKRIGDDAHASGQEWVLGPLPIVRMLRALRRSLQDLERHGAPRPAGGIGEYRGTRGAQAVVPLYPRSPYDHATLMGKADVRLQPGLAPDDVASLQAQAYREEGPGGVVLVLGAGNVSSLNVTDVLEQLFVHDRVALLKLNPVNAHLEPLVREALEPLVSAGFVDVVRGGADVGAYLCHHPGIGGVQITGSGRAFDAIVFGPGEEGRARKARRDPVLGKPVLAELGDVAPLLVVPGPWTARDLAYQAQHIATMLAHNAGFNCSAPRVIVQHAAWPQRPLLLDAVERVLGRVPTRYAYYPGAGERWRRFVAAHPEARRIGAPAEGELPWTLIADVPPEADDVCFQEEAFCGVIAETALDAADAADFLDRAVEFANERLWGTLHATILVHPASLRDRAVRAALKRATENLRYGTVGVNQWAGLSWTHTVAPWGGYPGSGPHDVRSGIGFVHNPLMLPRIEKTVTRAPFRSPLTPPWFILHRRHEAVARRLVSMEASPAPGKLLGVMGDAVRGWM